MKKTKDISDPDTAEGTFLGRDGILYRIETIVTPKGPLKVFLNDKGTSYFFTKTPFTGIARSMVCDDNHGHHNFRIVNLVIENDQVVSHRLSVPFMQAEAADVLDDEVRNATLNLNMNWNDGKYWAK